MMTEFEEIEQLVADISQTTSLSQAQAYEFVVGYIKRTMCLGYSFKESKEYLLKGVPIEGLILCAPACSENLNSLSGLTEADPFE